MPNWKNRDEIAELLKSTLQGGHFGTAVVQSVSWLVDDDADGDEAVYFTVTLSNPEGGAPTWPQSDLLALRRKVYEEAATEGLPGPVYVTLKPESEEEQEPEPAAEQVSGLSP
jgi:hypothetical protein